MAQYSYYKWEIKQHRQRLVPCVHSCLAKVKIFVVVTVVVFEYVHKTSLNMSVQRRWLCIYFSVKVFLILFLFLCYVVCTSQAIFKRWTLDYNYIISYLFFCFVLFFSFGEFVRQFSKIVDYIRIRPEVTLGNHIINNV